MGSVAVVGGGISGLASAFFLRERGHEVVVHEASERLGGKLRTESLGGVEVEMGADSFLPRDSAPIDLCRAVGLGDELISPAVFGAYIWHDGALRRLPRGFSYGIPVRPWAAYRAGLLTSRGALRASTEAFRLKRLDGPEPSIASFVTRRFGREVLDNLVDPMLAGTRAGAPTEIGLSSGAREIAHIAETRGSVIRGLRRQATEIGAGSPSFVSIRGGLSRLAEALAERLPDVRTGAHVDSLPKADAVVLATPPWETIRLASPEHPRLAEILGGIRYESTAIVTLLYPRDAFRPPSDGSGVLIPSRAGLTLTAATWYSHKWPHAAGVDGTQIVRCFVGGRGRTVPEDDVTIERVTADLAVVMGTTDEPLDVRVTRWERSMPVFGIGHSQRIVELDEELPRASRMALAGPYITGSGIPECIANARRAADQIDAFLAANGR